MKIKFYFSSDNLTGGHLYELHAYETLKRSGFNIYPCNVYTPYKKRGQTYVDGIYSWLKSSSKAGDLDIFDYTKSVWSTTRNKAQRIIIFHHYDPLENNKAKKYESNFKAFLKHSQNATVVVVSEYWKNKLLALELKDIHVIYNSFDQNNYQNFIPKNEFLQKYNLPDKPILYIGKNSIAKTLHAYNQLKVLENDYSIITSGPKREFEGPYFLNMPVIDYKSLLYHSTACLLFTDFIEGWSRIAHESILCGTPVIGNGSGGMMELLQLTNQTIMPELNLNELKSNLDNISINKHRVKETDRLLISRYNSDYFMKEWGLLVVGFIKSNK